MTVLSAKFFNQIYVPANQLIAVLASDPFAVEPDSNLLLHQFEGIALHTNHFAEKNGVDIKFDAYFRDLANSIKHVRSDPATQIDIESVIIYEVNQNKFRFIRNTIIAKYRMSNIEFDAIEKLCEVIRCYFSLVGLNILSFEIPESTYSFDELAIAYYKDGLAALTKNIRFKTVSKEQNNYISVTPAEVRFFVDDYNSMLNSKDVKMSKVMEKLYGSNGADKVFRRLEFLDPVLNRLIQDFAYEQVWGRIGGDDPDALKVKSIATISALIALGREEQIRIHLTGFFNLQGSIVEIKMLIKQLQAICGEAAAAKAELALDAAAREVVSEKQEVREGVDDIALPRYLQHVILLAARIALADKEKLEQALCEIATEKTLSVEEVGNIINHMAVYCGFPSAMDGFVTLKKCATDFSAEC